MLVRSKQELFSQYLRVTYPGIRKGIVDIFSFLCCLIVEEKIPTRKKENGAVYVKVNKEVKAIIGAKLDVSDGHIGNMLWKARELRIMSLKGLLDRDLSDLIYAVHFGRKKFKFTRIVELDEI